MINLGHSGNLVFLLTFISHEKEAIVNAYTFKKNSNVLLFNFYHPPEDKKLSTFCPGGNLAAEKLRVVSPS